VRALPVGDMAQVNELLMPKLGLTMTEGMLTEWAVAPGEAVESGELLFVVETDKVANDVCAEGAGEIVERLVEVGETVPVGTAVARWTGPGNAVDYNADSPLNVAHQSIEATGQIDAERKAPVAEDALDKGERARIVATPYARRLAREAGIDLMLVPQQPGKKRLHAEDIRRFAASAAKSQPEARAVIATTTPASAHTKAMATRMVEAKSKVPHFYLFSEADVGDLLALLAELNSDTGRRRITLNDCVLMAAIRALQACPAQNRIWQNGEIVQFNQVDLGMAVASDAGLMAPVLGGVGGCTLDELSARAADLAQRARDGALTRPDLDGGALTVSNGGMFGVTHMAPVINPPQSAILGIGSVRGVFRPDAQGAPALRQELGIVYAGDHRLHDGQSGLNFLNIFISQLEKPLGLLRSSQQQ